MSRRPRQRRRRRRREDAIAICRRDLDARARQWIIVHLRLPSFAIVLLLFPDREKVYYISATRN